MADRLETLLEPGETVLYRARGQLIGSGFFMVFGLAGVIMCFVIIIMCLTLADLIGTEAFLEELPEAIPGIALSLVMSALFLAPAWYLYRRCRAAVLITDRRLLYRPETEHATVAEMPLEEITAIEPAGDKMRHGISLKSLAVTDRAGRTLALRPLHREGRFAKALASAAGLGAPAARGGNSGLQALLVPGERLLYRDPRCRLPRPNIPEIVTVTCLMAMFLLAMETFDALVGPVWQTFAALLPIMIAVQYIYEILQLRATRVMVTDRRVVYRSAGLRPEFKDLPLGEIAALRCERAGPGGGVMVTTRSGRNLRLAHLGAPRVFARRLAEASGISCPSFDSQLTWFGALAFGPAGLACMAALHVVIVTVASALGVSLGDGAGVLGAGWPVLGLLTFGLAFTGGAYLGGLAAMAALRRFATAEEMHAAILALKSGPAQPGSGEWHGKVLLMWQRVLYGRAPAGDGGPGHGG